jgi:hypothetical protein
MSTWAEGHCSGQTHCEAFWMAVGTSGNIHSISLVESSLAGYEVTVLTPVQDRDVWLPSYAIFGNPPPDGVPPVLIKGNTTFSRGVYGDTVRVLAATTGKTGDVHLTVDRPSTILGVRSGDIVNSLDPMDFDSLGGRAATPYAGPGATAVAQKTISTSDGFMGLFWPTQLGIAADAHILTPNGDHACRPLLQVNSMASAGCQTYPFSAFDSAGPTTFTFKGNIEENGASFLPLAFWVDAPPL